MGHAHGEALVESAVLALVAVLLLDLAVPLALVILQLKAYGSSEEALQSKASPQSPRRTKKD